MLPRFAERFPLETGRRRVVSAVLVALLATACSPRQPKLYDVNNKVHQAWDDCVYVEVTNLRIDSHDEKTVRYSYDLKMRFNGSYPGQVECPANKRTLLEALAHKDIAALQPGEIIPATEETPY